MATHTAARAFHQNERDLGRALKELASGTRYVSPGVDPAGLAISENLAAQAKGYRAALRNTETATSFISIAESALAEQSNIIVRLRELAVQAASDTLSDVERGFLNDEFTQLVSELDRIALSTKYGSQPLLDGSTKEYEFQVGVHSGEENIIRYTNDTNTTARNLSLKGVRVDDKDDARDSLETLDEAVLQLTAARAKLGAIQSRLDTSISHMSTQVEAISDAYSRQAETNIPEAITRVRRGQILAQYQAVALQVANSQMENSLRLIA